jgi:hypothetical protein
MSTPITPATPKPQQTREQIQEAYTSWKKPGMMLDTPHNGRIIAEYMMRYFPNDWTHANLDKVATHPEVAAKLMWERGQSPAEIRETFEAWWKKTLQANPTLLTTPEATKANRLRVLTYISKFYGSRIDFTSLDASFEAVKDTLEYQKPLTPAELQAAAIKRTQDLEAADLVRRLCEAATNDEKSFYERRKALEKAVEKKDAETKAELDERKSKEVIDSLIEGYQKNHPRIPGRIDWAATESIKKALREFRVKRGGKVDWVLTAKELRNAIVNGVLVLDYNGEKVKIEL